ncbi:MAG: STAS domain-containing protein [Methylibium sp.]|uniref:STAS domain-containing protein n=1 Tax=Methylibium sp. TaxID=2067992 RepID=UPI0017ED9043|nr:STAS domain-containing protein [Methylibium sp.]MBA3598182.1 STAS domain-containing protein [Methylibium sp.]
MADDKSESKEGSTSFFRKVVKFVANPATDWAELNSVPDEPLQSGYAKSELKAMIERKRRNDFVRKREFDMLRKIRREGLPADGLAGIIGTSDLDDSDQPRASEMARPDATVKAKIDEIEQQMEGEQVARRTIPAHPPSFYTARTAAGELDERSALNQPFAESAEPAQSKPAERPANVSPAPAPTNSAATPPTAVAAPAQTGSIAWEPQAALPVKRAPLAPQGASDFNNPFAVEVKEIAHDPDLDEAVISFANAEFEACERSIAGLIAPDGERYGHAETWLVMFDLYRATGRQQPFESLALDYTQRFGWSPPQWFSIPQMVAAETPAPSRGGTSGMRVEGNVGWVAPAELSTDEVAELSAKTLQLPMPWVLDWSPLERIDPQACSELSQLMRHWSTQKIDMRWLGVEKLLDVLGDAAPTGVRDADPVIWLLRLEVLRLASRPDQFDEVAIDYCVTYEVSPPSWEKSLAKVKVTDEAGITLSSRSMVTDVSTGFAESVLLEETGGARTAAVELSGQLVGDIGKVLGALEARLGNAGVVTINCTRLIRMDFVAAGDLLNWVLSRRNEERLVHFDDAHRLLALFFNAMGINEHARVKVRNL